MNKNQFMDPLSSFAISFAVGVALDLWESRNDNLDKQIIQAFNAALNYWAKDPGFRERKKNTLKWELKHFLDNTDGIIKNDLDPEIVDFLSLFQKRLAETKHQAAYNYLSAINDASRYLELTNKLNQILNILDNQGIDPRDLNDYLDQLPFDQGFDVVEEEITNWYDDRKISPGEHEALKVIINKFKKSASQLAEEIEYYRQIGERQLADILVRIKDATQSRDPKKLLTIYEEHKETVKQKEITLLYELISASESIFAYEQTIEFYSKLVRIQPLANNYYNYAYYLNFTNFHSKAAENYKKALKIYRELAQENPSKYLPYVAMTLNNLANVNSKLKITQQAKEKYLEALRIRRDLAKVNPKTHLPYVAMTLYNLAILYDKLNKNQQAKEKYLEALRIRRDLAKENPKTYLPYVASTLHKIAELNYIAHEFQQAKEKFHAALEIRGELVKENPIIYLDDAAQTLFIMTLSFKNESYFQLAKTTFKELLKIQKELAQENPIKYLPYLALNFKNLAILHEAYDEFQQALEKYLEALDIYQKLAKKNPQTYLPHLNDIVSRLDTLP